MFTIYIIAIKDAKNKLSLKKDILIRHGNFIGTIKRTIKIMVQNLYRTAMII